MFLYEKFFLFIIFYFFTLIKIESSDQSEIQVRAIELAVCSSLVNIEMARLVSDTIIPSQINEMMNSKAKNNELMLFSDFKEKSIEITTKIEKLTVDFLKRLSLQKEVKNPNFFVDQLNELLSYSLAYISIAQSMNLQSYVNIERNYLYSLKNKIKRFFTSRDDFEEGHFPLTGYAMVYGLTNLSASCFQGRFKDFFTIPMSKESEKTGEEKVFFKEQIECIDKNRLFLREVFSIPKNNRLLSIPSNTHIAELKMLLDKRELKIDEIEKKLKELREFSELAEKKREEQQRSVFSKVMNFFIKKI